MWMIHRSGALGGKERVLDFVELELQAPVSCSTWVLGTELKEQCAFFTAELANHTFSVSFSRDQCRFSPSSHGFLLCSRVSIWTGIKLYSIPGKRITALYCPFKNYLDQSFTNQ